MELKFILQVIKLSLVIGIFSLPSFCFYFGTIDGISFFAGTVWACVNLWLIKNLVQKVLPFDQKNTLRIVLILAVKFPLLYFIGALLLTVGHLSPISMMAGFSLVLAAIFLNFCRGCIPKKLILLLFALTSVTSLNASLDSETPEVPNFFKFSITHSRKF